MTMSNAQVFGSPMILNGRKAVSPFGAASNVGSQRVAKLSELDDRLPRDSGLDLSDIGSAAQNAAAGGRRRLGH